MRAVRRSALRDVALLTVLCAVVFLPGATATGVLNTQEALRLSTAADMQSRGEWMVPTRYGEAYLAKPPLIYWAQMALAGIRGGEVDLIDLRLAVALAGWAGVLVTYFGARRWFGRGEDGEGDEVAWWAALALAVGLLYVRSSRTGELDIFLAPLVGLTLIGVHGAWRAHVERGRTSWGWVAVAAAGCAASALTKGPVPLIVIAVGGYVGIMLGSIGLREDGRGSERGAVVAGLVAGAAGLVVGLVRAEGAEGLAGAPVMAATLGGAAWVAWRCGAGVRAWAPAVWRAHPEIVLGAGAVALAAWGAVVRSRVGADAIGAVVSDEASNNLNVLVPESAARNVATLVYGLLPLGLAGLAGVVWLVRERVRVPGGRVMVLAWLGLGFAAFTLLGKGVPRYLTPVWPALAVVGGWWIVAVLLRGDGAEPRRARRVLHGVVVVMGVGQAVFYGMVQDRLIGDRSPRAIAPAVRGAAGFDEGRVGVYEISAEALEWYVGRRVERWDGRGRGENIGAMIERVRGGGGSYVLVTREETGAVVDRYGSILGRLEEAGIGWSRVEAGRWVEEPGRTEVWVLELRAGGMGAGEGDAEPVEGG